MNADVAFDGRITSHMSAGMRTYTSELQKRLPLVAPDLRFEVFGDGDNFDLAEQAGMPAWIARHKPRIVHYPTPFAPLYQSRPYILTIHDLIELRFPAFSKPRAIRYYRYVTGNLARRAACVICDDERTAADLTALLRVRPERIRVVPLGVDEAFFTPHPHEERERGYLLYAGNHRPHKDLPTLFRAWSQLPRDCAIDLYLTGVDDFGGALEAYGRDDARIVLLGDLDVPSLIRTYCGARALVHPALVEGFGLPLLEASALGTPVIAADASVPAILATAVTTFGPGDVSTLRLLLERAIRDPAEFRARAEAAMAIARTYTWDRCAQATAAVYRETLSAA